MRDVQKLTLGRLLCLLAWGLGQVLRRSWEQDLRRIETITESSR